MKGEIKDCPICGCENAFNPSYESLNDLARSYDICPCCMCEFGLDDEELWFEEWVAGGCEWFQPELKPENWKLENQLKNIIRPYPFVRHYSEMFYFGLGAKRIATPISSLVQNAKASQPKDSIKNE